MQSERSKCLVKLILLLDRIAHIITITNCNQKLQI